MLLAGIAGTLPTMANASYSLYLISLTGVAARRVGIVVGIVIVALAFFSKFTAILLTVPGPVLGAYLILAMGMLFVSGLADYLTRRTRLQAYIGGRARERTGLGHPRPSRHAGHFW
ncbi:MAG: hypothetical protein F4X57_07215 [Chloroflexi bacterium]|nr:hypothetical protein [Chloroflexota bacterium]